MIHIRAVSPQDTTRQLVDSLEANTGVLNLVVLNGVARNPSGDAVEFDVITAEAKIRAGGHYPLSWFGLLVIATLIGAVGIFTNSPILIVGAMVVGPEYAAIISVALAINKRDRAPVRKGLTALTAGFLIAILAAFLFSAFVRALDLQPQAFELGIRPVSDLVDTPSLFSLAVAVLAGIVGVVSLTEARANALIGVFISVTTIPAASDIGVSIAFLEWREARGSALQLLSNVAILMAVGAVGLLVQRRIWQRISRRLATAEPHHGR